MGLEDNYTLLLLSYPKHTAKKTLDFCLTCSMEPFEWPPQSPDLNPIENIWAIIDNKVEKKTDVTNRKTYYVALNKA